MIIYGDYSANTKCMIDFMEFEFPEVPKKFVPEDFDTNKDLTLSVDWDESDWIYDDKTHEGGFRLKGVYINQIYANGQIDLFREAILDAVQVYGPETADFKITALQIKDGESQFDLPAGNLTPRNLYYEGE